MTADDIRRLRERLDLSQMAFAIRLGVSVDTIRAYEQGRRTPSVMIQERIDEVIESLRRTQRDRVA